MEIANIGEAKAHLSELINKALAGEEVILARANMPIAKIIPYTPELKPRVGGFIKGQIIMEDEEASKITDAEIADLMLNSPIFP
jgi:prevent-host-death family protein